MERIVARLLNTSTTTLMYLCDRHKVSGKAMTRQQMLDKLLALFSDPEYVHRTVKGLARPLRQTLLAYAVSEYSWKAAPQLDKLLGEPHRPYLSDLEHLGFATAGGSVAPEAAEAAVRLWLEEIAAETAAPKQIIKGDPSGPGSLRDIFALIGMGWRKELPITRDGKLHKKAEEEMLGRMEGSPIIKGGLKALVLSYALTRGILVQAAYDEHGKTGLIATDLAGDWAVLSWGEIWADLADFLLTSRAKSLPVVSHLISSLATFPPDRWLSHERLVAEHSSLTGAEPQTLEGLLFLMAGLELLEVGTTAGNNFALRPAPALRALLWGKEPRMPDGEQRFVVDPTFTVTAPKTVSPEVLSRLERWCGERKADAVLTYRLSQASLRVALEAGDKPADVIRFFEEGARAGLPQNVLFSLREWTAGARKARFEQVTLLRVGDADTAQRVLGDKALRKWVFDQLTPTDLIVDAAAVEKVRKRLGEIGVAAAPGVGRPGEAASGPSMVWQSETAGARVSAQQFRQKWVDGDQQDG